MQFDTAAVASLNLANISAAQLKVITAAILAKPVSPAEATLTMLQIPILQSSSPVDYVNSSPPELRTRKVLHGNEVVAHAIDLYAARPSCLDAELQDMTFYTYQIGRAHV